MIGLHDPLLHDVRSPVSRRCDLGNLIEMAPLQVLSNRSRQNQLVLVPLPAAAWAGLSLIGAMGLRRKLRKA